MRKALLGLAFLVGVPVSAATAQEEPWGGNVPGWRFTQNTDRGTNCRAIQGPYLIARQGSGRSYVSLPGPAGLSRGWYRDGRATIIIGGQAEPIDAEVPGRLLLHLTEQNYQAIIRARGYQWRIAGPRGVVSGSVSFSGDLARVNAELRACIRANTAAARPAPARTPAPAAAPAQRANMRKWSGDWVWINPMQIFGKPVYIRSLSIEYLTGNRVNICIDVSRPDTCKNMPFTQHKDVFLVTHSGSDGFEIRFTNNMLVGKYWFQGKNWGRTGPDATFTLR